MNRRITVHALVMSLAALVGCVDARHAAPSSPRPLTAPATTPTQPSLQGVVVTVAQADGQTLVEFTTTNRGTLEAGTPFRLHSADGSRIKGMLQITEAPATGRAICRVIALTSANDAPVPGDQVRELQTLGDGGAGTEVAAKSQVQSTTAGVDADDARFAAVRAQYQRLIAEAVARHDTELADSRRANENRLAEADAMARRNVATLEQVHAAALAAARAAGGEQALTVASAERQAADARAQTTLNERNNLRIQVDGLVQAQDELHKRIERLVQERDEADRAAKARLTAEAEAREQIAGRLAEIERQAGGKASAAAAMLSKDPMRDEGILERLQRLSAESTIASDRATRAEAAASEAQQALLACRRQLEEAQAAQKSAEGKLAHAGEVDGKLSAALNELEAAYRELAGARERQSATELSRLEAERALYDLSARVLRLPTSGPDQAALQERLRALLGAQVGQAPAADANAPERTP